jgi:hypothetical protein
MFRGFDNYPPGHPRGNRRSEITVSCTNRECDEYNQPREVTQVYERETGAAYIEPEEDGFCEACGEDMDA